MMPADHPPPLRGASTPTLPLPENAWDTHTHVFGPFDSYPLAADCRYQPPFAPREAHLAVMTVAGFARGVVVHASANGFDNNAVLDAVAHSAGRLHAVAVVPEDISDAGLGRLHDAGVRGVRFTENGDFIGAPKGSGMLGLHELRRMAPRLRELGWYAQIWAKCEHLIASEPWLFETDLPLVIDHMGAFNVALGVDHPSFQRFVGWASQGKLWVKLTSTRVSRLRWRDCADVRPFHDALVESAPDRLIWGSDWPFIAMDKDLPDIGGLVDLFDEWTADTTLRHKIFVKNPQVLFGHS